MQAELPPQSDLCKILDYSPETGVLTWRSRDNKAFNARFSGQRAGYIATRGKLKYLVVEIDGSPRYAHKIICKMQTGLEPAQVDHENNDGLDNRWDNLRACNNRSNQGNRRRTPGKILPKCVRASGRGFAAHITKYGKFVHLGTFDTAEEASAAYLKAALDYFGKFAKKDI